MLDRVIDFMSNFGLNVDIVILQDNINVIQEATFSNDGFVREISKYDFQLLGMNDREFYIKTNSDEYTIQVSNFELEDTLSLI